MKVDSSLYLNSQNQTREGNANLDKDAFLKILMTQLTNQDPLDPMKDQDFVAQMASFSQLEQMTNMSSGFESFVNQQISQNFLQFSNLIDKEVSYQTREGEEIKELTATVESVKREGNEILLSLNNGQTISAAQVYQIESSMNEEEVV
ncbi:flagellar hook assembly protein FlgD [Piscibacillus salipiscarius]|uniref:Flagellar hook assembly protein FlgD n=1 Tax=Piscibacillus salipiscarius TaxID=299480 RepID=A0ABW5Q9J1_9BACI|nr:flagellar hook assembly protein FlgD [Piscibacillus salipiscarius]